jgi:hypothetical protein
MDDPFDRAERYRLRATELRASAAEVAERDVRAALMAVADALDEHARNLEATTLWLRSARRTGRAPVTAAADWPFRHDTGDLPRAV